MKKASELLKKIKAAGVALRVIWEISTFWWI